MPITLNTTLRNARATAIVNEAGATAKLSVYTASYATLLYTSTCAATLGTVSGGVLTFNAVGNATAVAAGTAAIARGPDGGHLGHEHRDYEHHDCGE